MGVVPPAEGFPAGLRRRCDEAGALLVIDEVITGFRLGDAGAQGLYGVTPDLSCFGKVLGGGLPLAAFGGRAEIMDHLAPAGPVYQAGTLSGNPLATAAGLAVLEQLDQTAYRTLQAKATRLADGLTSAATTAGLDLQVPRVGPLLGLFFASAPVTDYDTAREADAKRYALFFHALLDRGIYLAPSPFEATFVTLSHTDTDIDTTVQAASEALAEVAAETG
jgi:glutamate-1-semialdehyde 2,1-aminomutase